ncbi:piRNA biogenesis protein EXD1 [Pimephales promelas]|uniref:piRNA biogenesis protein EXD1 n=1 Tax=Pimephales promelas TaxID=90988 RepID=UPI001955C27C|nr:piRNA biogenesis protein EXD1 [Pimephales promelas]KAG1936403.1 piRNA biogenesis protein EXD1 [Pimephales promelas]
MNSVINMASYSDECRFLDELKKNRVKITLSDTEITGVIQRVHPKKTLLLEDVSEVKSGRKFPGVKQIFGHEIVKVEFISSLNEDHVNEEQRSEFSSFRRKIIMDGDEHDLNYVLIDELHEKFGPAVMHIKEQRVIGLGADVFGQTEQERLCWLQVATKRVVYLFDILLLGGQAIKNGLSMILENPNILKVVHDCRCVARCLRAQFNVNLTNVFDTQVADLMLFYTETGGFLPDRLSRLPELLHLHLKLPAHALTPLWAREQHTQECAEVWYLRPCPPLLMSAMASAVLHLLPLRLLLLDALMADYTLLVDTHMSSGHDQSLLLQQEESALPREAVELLSVRRERREWATVHYSLTDAGLLDRSSFRPSPLTHTHSA